MIERVQIGLLRVMSGYSVRAAFTHAAPWPDDSEAISVMHGWVLPADLESDRDVLEHLSEELYNLAPRFTGRKPFTPDRIAAVPSPRRSLSA